MKHIYEEAELQLFGNFEQLQLNESERFREKLSIII
jgi:hypothetical protein